MFLLINLYKYILFCCIFCVHDGLEAERLESVAQAGVELTHELHPVQAEGVQECGQAFHHDENCNGEEGPHSEQDEYRGN